MNQPYDAYGRPVAAKSSAPLIVGLIAGFGFILLLAVYFTGALDRMFGRGSGVVLVANASGTAPAAAPEAEKAPETASVKNEQAAAPEKAAAVDNRWIDGRWCDAQGFTSRFEHATGRHFGTDESEGSAAYSLNGSRLTIDGNAWTVRRTGPDTMEIGPGGQPPETRTRC